MSAESRIQAYYEALRDGDPLAPSFARGADVVKFGISERLDGYEAIEAGLTEQTRTTADWTVESRDLRVTERDRHAWFADVVTLGWTDTERGIRFEFETRWSGTLERDRRSSGEDDGSSNDGPSDERSSDERSSDEGKDASGTWRFVGMHVSTAGDI